MCGRQVGDPGALEPQFLAAAVQKRGARQAAHRVGADAALAAGAALGNTSGPFWPQAVAAKLMDASASSRDRVKQLPFFG
jgi:hypothetical protein